MSKQIQQIEDKRLLLDEPDPVIPTLSNLSQSFRDELNKLKQEYDEKYDYGILSLKADSNWQQLETEQKEEILISHQIDTQSRFLIYVQSPQSIINTLEKSPLSAIRDMIAALPVKFSAALSDAAKLLEPQTQVISLKRKTLKTGGEIDTWLEETGTMLKKALDKGPIILQ
jgi:hypothetical protein